MGYRRNGVSRKFVLTFFFSFNLKGLFFFVSLPYHNSMLEIKNNKHSKWQTAYHIVWIPKYRKPVLKGKIEKRLKELIYEIADEYGFDILALEIMPDHKTI